MSECVQSSFHYAYYAGECLDYTLEIIGLKNDWYLYMCGIWTWTMRMYLKEYETSFYTLALCISLRLFFGSKWICVINKKTLMIIIIL